jgi:anhydro-N-acetylmuramic acid kinase
MNSWISHLQTLASRPSRTVAGIISGTSMEAMKIAICEIEGGGIATEQNAGARVQLLSFSSHPYDSELREVLFRSLKFSTQEIAEQHVRIGETFAQALIESFRTSPSPVSLIGSHGQTVYHHSNCVGSCKTSLQIGDGDVIAERTGLPVFADFRARDIAAGGEGAPLTPYSDAVLFRSVGKDRVILNMGGVANITVLHPVPSEIIGFDTGPANGPLDRISRRLSSGQKHYDRDGDLARAGKVNESLLQELLEQDGYLQRPPPKSTGFEMYGDDFVENLATRHGALDIDLLATATEFVARSIAKSLELFVPFAVEELIVAGGGGNNLFLLERIAHAVRPARVFLSDEVGVPAQAREAMAFAIFANDALLGFPTTLPSVTGARSPRILGKLCLPNL